MNSLDNLYEQYYNLLENIQENTDKGIATNLLQYGITEDYYNEVVKSAELLRDFYDKYMTNEIIHSAVYENLNDNHAENVKFCMMVDVLRCYDGLDHPTSFTTPEGIALMVLIGKIFGLGEISSYEQLKVVSSTTLTLIDIIPYISEFSNELGKKYSLFMSTIFEKESPDIDQFYRKLIYNLCKIIAEVDGKLSLLEEDWLNEIALLNDNDPDNDIDVNDL